MSSTDTLLMWSPSLFAVVFFFALGAVVGSFLNVVVYRLPRGQGLARPASACPACGTPLTWRENIPILGWVFLRGRCRFCRSPISPEYPIVETVVALLFGGLVALWCLDPAMLRAIGVDPSAVRPEWAYAGLRRTWPILVLHLWLVGSLVGITLIDAKTYLIPLSIPWLAAGLALVAHPLLAAWYAGHGGLLGHHAWFIWTFEGLGATGLAAGAGLGLVFSIALLRAGILRPSFADYEEWEAGAQRDHDRAEHDSADGPSADARVALPVRLLLLTGPALALMAAGFSIGLRFGFPMRGMLGGMAVGLLFGMVLRARLGADASDDASDPAWIRYPHARREMVREIVFLAPAVALGALGFVLARDAGVEPPLWVRALTGSMIGLLAGGGVVWAVRIVGSIAFGKEAMGLGDVHLMAAVGATLGWVDPVLAFFIAPFFGIAWTLLAAVVSLGKRGRGTALPYGPHLAAATLVMIYAQPLVESALSMILGRAVHLP